MGRKRAGSVRKPRNPVRLVWYFKVYAEQVRAAGQPYLDADMLTRFFLSGNLDSRIMDDFQEWLAGHNYLTGGNVRKTRTGQHFRIDEKHHLEVQDGVPVIVKSGNGERIPLEEPVILFRGRDRLALPLLTVYRQMCADDGATDYQLASMDRMIQEFKEFAEGSGRRFMKQPGITRGK